MAVALNGYVHGAGGGEPSPQPTTAVVGRSLNFEG